MFESVTDGRTHGRTPAVVPFYKLAEALGSVELKLCVSYFL